MPTVGRVNSTTLLPAAESWQFLAESGVPPLLGPQWCEAALAHLHRGAAIKTITLTGTNGLAAHLPWAASIRQGLTWLEPPGASALFEPQWPPATSDSLLPWMKNSLSLGHPLALSRLPIEHPLWQLLPRLPAAARLGAKTASSWVDTRLGWDAYFASRSSRRRSDYRRALRKAGDITLEAVRPTPLDFETLYKEAVAIEHSSWKGEQATSLLARPDLFGFYHDYGLAMAKWGWLRMFFLRRGGKRVAMQYVLERNRRLWVLKVGYRADMADCSPGLLLTLAVIRHACEQSLDAYEFLGDIEPWITPWATDQRNYRNLYLFPKSTSGRLALALYDSRTWLKRQLSKSPFHP